MDFKELTKKIEEYDTITIFRHQRPDCDALGSQFALLTWLKDNYPDKKVYALGYEKTSQCEFPDSDILEDEVIQNSLAIVVDTATIERIDDKRCVKASYVIKIDHHPNVEAYGNLILVDDAAAAVCEILTLYFQSETEKEVSRGTAEFLYRGLLTDTLSYSTSNTTARTLEAGAYLAEKGIDIPQINRDLFDKSLKEYRFASMVRSRVQIMDGGRLGYVILQEKELIEWGFNMSEAKNNIDEFGKVKDFEIWALFCGKTEKGVSCFDGSIRSKKVVINTLCAQYNGGGHKNACGVKNLSEETMYQFLDDLNALIPKAD